MKKTIYKKTPGTVFSIIDLSDLSKVGIERAAEILFDSFKSNWPDAWPDLNSTRQEVHQALHPERICRAAVDQDGALVGWIGAISQYDGRVFELHPLCVASPYRKLGIGSLLVADLEERVTELGGLTIYLGTDDENDLTTLSGVDLYDEPWRHIKEAKPISRHPLAFYRKLGFEIVGIIPDANGRGKPDIMMAKKIAGA
ncbi:MAG: GNAT family N-acetyltransferase [Candidatus Obscuribacterales bacterium]|nr:GNAT family N-acetyltransferase [Candidatus Obscuribacterales bacterium]